TEFVRSRITLNIPLSHVRSSEEIPRLICFFKERTSANESCKLGTIISIETENNTKIIENKLDFFRNMMFLNYYDI
ncbi:MAG TPA: hypothetical protein VD651_02390, partial [Nitrosarchaeum sp.]|nr:hypothetical protein [Nitrosarchaeum sp.]